MQPKRDPDDRRYWPAHRPGATGSGFTNARDKRNADPRYLQRRNPSAGYSMDVTTTGVGKGRTADAVRARSRDLYERLLDKIEGVIESDNVFTLNELSSAANVAGRIGLGGDEVRSGDIRIHIVRDAVPAQPDNRLLATPSTTIYSSVDVPDGDGDAASQGVSDDAPYPYVTEEPSP